MAFHGGLIGALIGILMFARRYGAPALTVADLCSLVAPIGIFLGRIANFIRPELWGRPTDVPGRWSFREPTGCRAIRARFTRLCSRGSWRSGFSMRSRRWAPAPSGRAHRGLRHRLRRGAYFQRIFSRTGSPPGGPWAGADHGDGPFLSAHRRRARVARVEFPAAGNLSMTKLLDEIRALIQERGPITRRAVHAARARPSRSWLLHEP